MTRVLPWPGCIVRVEALPWAGGGWLVSYWQVDRLLAVVEVPIGAYSTVTIG